ncbi:accessory Sec system protein translocase subunit SecY2 [Streptococcus sp. KHUD_014]|uniref:accessory Sec system protein translocase subunit SecY2 n=1 Tax=Streptococcus sp. KHUD_014 TaxID=3434353 RepID=UPI003DA5CA3A
MKKKLTSVVVKRVMWTISFLFIYVLGSRLTLPFVNVNDTSFLGGTAAFLAFSTAMTGGNLRSLSLFSVGLSPWMSAMILWQMFSMTKKLGLGSLPLEVQDRGKMILTIVIALIQALAITLNLPIQSGVNYGLVLTMNTLLLIAGTFFLVWLSDLNSLFGVGGSMVILMSSMVASMPQNIVNSIKELQVSPLFVALLLMFSLAFLYIAVIMQRARYRILVNKITIHNRFKRYSYFDIQLNPAGGMPFMYAMSLVSIPQYLLMLLQIIFPNVTWVQDWIGQFAIGRPVWLYTYIVVLFILGLAFSFVNMNGEEIAEKMKKSGEYIYNIYPGEETSRYINWLILRFAVIGSTYTVLMAGLPMLIVLYDPRYMQLTMLPGLFLIFNGMVFNIKEEIDALTLNENYRPLLEIDS